MDKLRPLISCRIIIIIIYEVIFGLQNVNTKPMSGLLLEIFHKIQLLGFVRVFSIEL